MAEAPRLANFVGKYAKQPNTNTTTTVRTGGTTITSNGKTQINIFKNHGHCGPRPKGNVFLNGRHYNVPIFNYGGNYNMGGWNNMGYNSLMNGLGNIFGGGCCGSYKKDNWDRFMDVFNAVGPMPFAMLGGGLLAGLGTAISKAFSSDAPVQAGGNMPSVGGTISKASYGQITDKDAQDLLSVQEYNKAAEEVTPLYEAVTSKQATLTAAQNKEKQAQQTVNKHELNLKNLGKQETAKQKEIDGTKANIEKTKTTLTTAEQELSKLESAEPRNEQAISAAKTKIENLKKELEQLENKLEKQEDELEDIQDKINDEKDALSEAKEELTTAQNETKTANEELKNAKSEYDKKTADINTKKTKAEDDIRQMKGGLDAESTTTTPTVDTNKSTTIGAASGETDTPAAENTTAQPDSTATQTVAQATGTATAGSDMSSHVEAQKEYSWLNELEKDSDVSEEEMSKLTELCRHENENIRIKAQGLTHKISTTSPTEYVFDVKMNNIKNATSPSDIENLKNDSDSIISNAANEKIKELNQGKLNFES